MWISRKKLRALERERDELRAKLAFIGYPPPVKAPELDAKKLEAYQKQIAEASKHVGTFTRPFEIPSVATRGTNH